MSKLGTQKYSNYEYAPGIATYGIDGHDGGDGRNGCTLFISVYSINDDQGLVNFSNCILQNLNMTNQSGTKINRDYIDGDSFVFQDGSIWRMDNVKDLRNAAATNQINTENITDYMSKVGNIVSTVDDGFSESGNFLVLDTANYKGFMIDTTGVAGSASLAADYVSPFTILSNDIANDNKTYFLSLKSIFAGESVKNLNIYYDNDNSAWVINSDSPIIFDCDVKISDEIGNEDYDNYSKPLIADERNNITTFYAICNKLSATYSNPVVVTEGIDDGQMKTTVKKMSNFSVEYCPIIEFAQNTVLSEYDKIKIYMKDGNNYFTDKNMFDGHTFKYNIRYDDVIVESKSFSESIYSKDNETYNDKLVMYKFDDTLRAYYINLDTNKIINNYTLDDKLSVEIIWTKVYLKEPVNVSLNISFQENMSYHKTVEFHLNEDEDSGVISELLNRTGIMFHLYGYSTISNRTSYNGLVESEYFVPFNNSIATDKKFTLPVGEDITDKTIWVMSIIDGVEVNVKIEKLNG